jgi:hypothetical protein
MGAAPGSVGAARERSSAQAQAPGERGRLQRAGAGRAGAGLARERHAGPGDGVQGDDV